MHYNKKQDKNMINKYTWIIHEKILLFTHLKFSEYQGISGVGEKFDRIIRLKTIYMQSILTIVNKIFIHKVFLDKSLTL